MSKIVVIAEHRNGVLAESTLELFRAAGEMAAAVGCEAAAAVFSGDNSIAEKAAQYIPEVYSVTDASLSGYTQDGYVQAAGALAAAVDVKGFLVAQSYDGVDFAARVAMAVEGAVVSNCVKASAGADGLLLTRNVYNGKIREEKIIKDLKSSYLPLRRGAYEAAEAGQAGTVIPVPVTMGPVRTTVKEVIEAVTGAVDISQARIIVAGGRGCKDADKFRSVIIPLAEKLGGEYAASRPVVDAGWAEPSRQVGQSGKVVTPDLYIALGISGAVQHVAGMKGAKCIVAVNKDPEAPIFNLATYGIVGDLFEVVSAMMEKL